MKKLLLLLCTVVFVSAGLIAQRTVHGTVLDESGLPLIGAQLLKKTIHLMEHLPI
ncbi:MAG: hypothetical protein R2771_08420 [Saprospiraceae bacterium]